MSNKLLTQEVKKYYEKLTINTDCADKENNARGHLEK